MRKNKKNRLMNVPRTAAFIFVAAAIAVSSPAWAELKLKLAHNTDPKDPVHKSATIFAEEAGKLSNGEINVRVYPAAQLGKTKEVQEGVQQGFVDIVIESIGTLSGFHPVAGVESMPYLFEDAGHYVRVWNGPVGLEVKELLANEANFRIFGHMFRGTRELTSNKKVTKIEDLKGLKIRVTPIKERLATWKTFGANPTPMAFSEVFTALQQGVIEAQENPIPTISKNSFWEVQKYLILTSHMANGFTFQMNAKKFAGYSKETKDALIKAADKAAEYYNKYVRENEQKLLDEMASNGMEIVKIDQAPFRAKAKEVVAQFPAVQDWYLKMVEAK